MPGLGWGCWSARAWLRAGVPGLARCSRSARAWRKAGVAGLAEELPDRWAGGQALGELKATRGCAFMR